MKRMNFEKILFSLKLMGIKENDILLVHSALTSIGHVEGGPDTVINALLAAVEKGTRGDVNSNRLGCLRSQENLLP